MSGSNALGIAAVGAIISTKIGGEIGTWLGFAAVIFATVNVVGGFMVTDRMLKMFKRSRSNMNLENALYVLSSVLFIFGIKRLSHPKTARRELHRIYGNANSDYHYLNSQW